MADLTLRAVLTGSATGLMRSFEEASTAAAAAGDEMSDAMSGAGVRVSSDLEKVGKDSEEFIAGDLGNAMGQGSKDVEKLANDAEKHGSRLGSIFSKIGNAASNMGIPFSNSLTKMGEKMGDTEKDSSSFFSKLSTVGGASLAGITVGAVAFGAASVDMASKWQTSMTQLVTGAGESKKNIDMVSEGLLNMAGATGTSTTQLASGMYMVESAGYHGAEGLSVLKAAAEGAKVGNADLGDSANALTSILHDYHLAGDQATSTMSALVATVGAGKMHMQDLTTAMGAVLPTASALGVSFPEVGGALATMTASGMTARRAATNLQSTLLALAAPAKTAETALGSVGLTAQQVKNSMAEHGLSATLDMITEKVGEKFPKSSVAYTEALRNILGGTTGYQTALKLTGDNASIFAGNVDTVSRAMNHGGDQVQGFAEVQQDLGFQMDQAKDTVEALGTKFGSFLIPKLEAALHVVMTVVGWFEKHTIAAKILAGVIAGVLAVAIGAFAITITGKFLGALKKVMHPMEALRKALGLNAEQAEQTANTQVVASEESSAAIEEQAEATQTAAESMQGSLFAIQEGEEATADTMTETAEVAEATGGGLGPIGMILGAAMMVVMLMVQHWSAVKDALVDVWHVIAGIGETVFNALAGFFEAVFVDPLKMLIGLWNDGLQNLDALWHTISDDAKAAWNAIVDFFTDIWNAILDLFEPAKLEATMMKHWATIKSDAIDAWDAIVAWMGSIPDKILHALGDLGTLLLSAGKSIMDGLYHGLVSGFDKVTGFMGHAAHDVEHFFTDPLSIFSPSKVFISHGQSIMDGLAIGIQNGTGQVASEMNKVAQMIAGTSMSATASPLGSGLQSSTAAAAAAGNKTINATINAQTNADPTQLAHEMAWLLKTMDV